MIPTLGTRKSQTKFHIIGNPPCYPRATPSQKPGFVMMWLSDLSYIDMAHNPQIIPQSHKSSSPCRRHYLQNLSKISKQSDLRKRVNKRSILLYQHYTSIEDLAGYAKSSDPIPHKNCSAGRRHLVLC